MGAVGKRFLLWPLGPVFSGLETPFEEVARLRTWYRNLYSHVLRIPTGQRTYGQIQPSHGDDMPIITQIV